MVVAWAESEKRGDLGEPAALAGLDGALGAGDLDWAKDEDTWVAAVGLDRLVVVVQ